MKIENLCINCMREKSSPEGRCQYCGFDPAGASVPHHHLAPFVILAGKYLVGRAIGEGGFGITYIGMDLNLEIRVAIKEYYPNGCAIRDSSGNSSTVQSYAGEQQAFFETGREKFINEAKVLAKCINLPGIVTVKDFFKENHTAYIVMEYVDGKTLKSYLKEKGGRISADETLRMMRPVIKSLGEVHKMNLIHRDISPDNIMIRQDGTMKVLDFGGARDFAAAGGKSMSIMLKPGYAPEEQYRTHGEQGPWTDVYALCATMYRCITGEIPPDAMDRTYQDHLKPISSFSVSCPGNVAYAIEKGVSVYKNARYLSMEELYAALFHAHGGNSGSFQDRRDGSSQNAGISRSGVEPYTKRNAPVPPASQKASKLPAVAAVIGGIFMFIVIAAAVKIFILESKDTDSAVQNTSTQVSDLPVETENEPEDSADPQVKTVPSETPEPTATPVPTSTPVPVPVVNKIDMGHVQNLLGGRGSGASSSLYIYDLNQDAGRGTDNSEESRPASALITIPILYTVAKQIDNGMLSLDTLVPFQYSYQGGRGSLKASQNGQNVTVNELLQNMLMYSDNNAINTMIDTLGLETINSTCKSAGFTSVDLQRKIISGSSPLNNYISAKDIALITKALYNNTFRVINRDYIRSYMRVIDKAGRLGIFQTDTLYNGGDFCSQNGIVPDQYSGRYVEMGIIFADDQAYIIGAMAESGNADVAASEFSDAVTYIHSCMKEG